MDIFNFHFTDKEYETGHPASKWQNWFTAHLFSVKRLPFSFASAIFRDRCLKNRGYSPDI